MRRALAHGRTMTARYLTHVVRTPEQIAIYFTVPTMFVLVFGYVLGGAMAVPDGGSYREFLLPGVFVMVMLYGLAATATGWPMMSTGGWWTGSGRCRWPGRRC